MHTYTYIYIYSLNMEVMLCVIILPQRSFIAGPFVSFRQYLDYIVLSSEPFLDLK